MRRPGDLELEQQTCRAACLVTVGLQQDAQIEGFRAAVAANVRQCTYFIQVFQDDWGPRSLFRKMFYLATECRDDSSLPMREVIVCLKDAPRETDPEILAFRKELEERQDVQLFRFDKAESLNAHLLEVCSGWVRSIVDSGQTAGS